MSRRWQHLCSPRDLIVTTALRCINMSSDRQALAVIQASGGDGNTLTTQLLKKQAGTALVTESAPKTGHRLEPLEAALFQQGEVSTPRGCGGDKMAAGAAALFTVAGDHLAQRPVDFIGDRCASTAACCFFGLWITHWLFSVAGDAPHLRLAP